MDTKQIYLGTWFPRTSVHLRELNNFLTKRNSLPGLKPQLLQKYRQNLQLTKIIYHSESEYDFLEIICSEIRITVTEDGIILLSINIETDQNAARRQLETFYAEKFIPALSYIFSRGAPLPKPLSKIEEVYPLFLISQQCTSDQAQIIFKEMGDSLLSTLKSPALEICLGNKTSLLNIKEDLSWQAIDLEDLLRILIFFREFESQLKSYLHLHRDMWDELSRIRESQRMRYRDFPTIRAHILESLKTLSYVKARLAQMEDIMAERIKTVNLKIKKELVRLGLNRFEHLEADQKYINDLLEMTIDYVKGTLSLLDSLFQENTQRELGALKLITLFTAITSFFGMNIAFPWEDRWPNIFESSLVVLGVIAALSFGFYILLKRVIFYRHFAIKEEMGEYKEIK